MVRFLALIFILFFSCSAHAQCSGQFAANQICGNPTASQGLPTAMNPPYWTATRVAVTGNKTLTSSDCFTVQDLGGTGSYTLTLTAAAGYTANCAVSFYNSDATRGRFIAPAGVTTFRIFPLQTVRVWNDNGAWTVDRPTRFKLTAAKTVFVDTAGSDTANDCFATGATGACATMQGAADLIAQNFDLGKQAVTIQGAAGQTFANVLVNAPWVGGIGVTLDCGAASTMTTATAAAVILLRNGGVLTASTCIFTSTTGTRHAVQTDGTGSSFICGATLNFGAVTGSHLFATNQSRINCASNYTISGVFGATQFHAFANNSSVVVLPSNGTITFTTSLVSGALLRANFLGQLQGTGITWSLGVNTATISSYVVDYNAVMQTNGTCASIPGTIGGSATFGGLCQ